MALIPIIMEHIGSWGFVLLFLIQGIVEFAFGYYRNWRYNDRMLDLGCIICNIILINPLILLFSSLLVPVLFPQGANYFSWVALPWAFIIVSLILEFLKYWYHRLYHTVPALWKLHATHHSANYMGVTLIYRDSMLYKLLDPQLYVISVLAYMGLYKPILIWLVFSRIVVMLAHSSIRWDQLLYKTKWLQPLAYVIERIIVLPATHHAHHAAHERDGIGHYHGNFASTYFFFDILFGTAKITRHYPATYGVEDAAITNEKWYTQILYPFIRSTKSFPNITASVK